MIMSHSSGHSLGNSAGILFVVCGDTVTVEQTNVTRCTFLEADALILWVFQNESRS